MSKNSSFTTVGLTRDRQTTDAATETAGSHTKCAHLINHKKTNWVSLECNTESNKLFVFHADNSWQQYNEFTKAVWHKNRYCTDIDVRCYLSYPGFPFWLLGNKRRLRNNVQDYFQKRFAVQSVFGHYLYHHVRHHHGWNSIKQWVSKWFREHVLLTVASALQ